MGTLFEIDHATGVVDFKKNGTTNLVVEKGSSFPGTPTDGHLFYRTDLTQFFVYDNTLTDWKTQAGGSLRIYNETPSGTVDGVNTVFTVVNQYVAGTTIVTRNGLVMKPGDDYTETTPSTGTITFATAPTGGSILLVSYSRTIGQDVPKLLKFTVEVGVASGTYTGSTTVFDLPFSYTPGASSLLVFSGGVIMAVGGAADYLETDSNTVTFNTARTGGEIVQFLKLGVANDLGNTGGWVEEIGKVTLETTTNLVGIGTSSPSSYNANARQLVIASTTGSTGLTIKSNSNAACNIGFADAEGTTLPGVITYQHNATAANETLLFRVGSLDSVVITGTGQTQFLDGSAETPIMAFASDPDTGLFRPNTNKIGFSAGGIQAFQVDGSVGNEFIYSVFRHSFADGTAALPSLSFTSDQDTGFFHSATNAIGIVTQGVLRSEFTGGVLQQASGGNLTIWADNCSASGPNL